MKIEKFDKEKHYEKIYSWWKDHEQPPLAVDLLPNTGILVDGIVALFLYQTDSKVAFMENLISDKNSNKEHRRKAIDVALSEIIKIAKEKDFKYIISYPTKNSKRLENLHNEWGFTLSDENTRTAVRRL